MQTRGRHCSLTAALLQPITETCYMHDWIHCPACCPLSRPLAERSTFVFVFFALPKYPERLGQLTKLIKLNIALQQCVPLRVYCHLLEAECLAVCETVQAATFLSEPPDCGCNCGSSEMKCSASPLLAEPPGVRGGWEMKFGWDDGWPDSLVFGPGMRIYCKFVHISLCVPRKKTFSGGFLASAAEFPKSPGRKKKTSTEHRSLITVQKAIDCTIWRLCNCLLQQWCWSDSRRAMSRWDSASTAIPTQHDSLQELRKFKSKMGIWQLDYQVAWKESWTPPGV